MELDDTVTSNETSSLGASVAKCVRRGLDEAPITPIYATMLRAALALPGNILSDAPDVRWARPVRACCACAAAGGAGDHAVAVAAAVEVQMVALDLLDDVEDGESNPVLAAYGLPAALNATTGLVYLAQRMLSRLNSGVRLTRILADAGLRATSGQHADLTLTAGRQAGLDTALEITAGKSGSLMAAACQLGAAAAGTDEARQGLFARFGSLAGVVAQLANDIAALAPTVLDKTDRVLHRPTLPLVYAARIGISAPRLDQPVLTLDDSGGPFAWAVAAAHRTLAIELIPALTADPACQADLAHLLHPL